MMRLDESSLKTDEPYLIPGYCGYCPQFKYKIEDTFGKTTHQLLTNRSQAKAHVLAPLELDDLRAANEAQENHRIQLIRTRGETLGEQQKYGESMVPGYTGYIPKGQHYFGDRYAMINRNAISHFESDQREYNLQQERLRTLIRSQNNGLNKPLLKPIIEKTRMYFPKGIQHSLSPYTIANDDPRKYMISGYTGFVPRSRGIIGMSYPSVTNRALCDFTTEFAETKAISKTPITLQRPKKVLNDAKAIYSKDSGMVPHYTGHVPGEKFRYGRTFGHSTTNVVNEVKSGGMQKTATCN